MRDGNLSVRRPSPRAHAPRQDLVRVAEPLPRAIDVRPAGRERDRLGLELGHAEQCAVGIVLGERRLDPLGESLRLARQRGSAIREPLVRRRPDMVQREDDANDPRRIVDDPLEQRQTLA